MRTSVRLSLVLCTALLVPRSAHAQSEASQLIAQAREQIDALNADSAFGMLQRALQRTPTEAERVRAFTLLGITQLSRDDRVGARLAFEQALRLDGGLRVDSLTDLHTDLRLVFGEARTALGITDAAQGVSAAPRLTVAVDVPGDTGVPASGGLLRIEAQPSYGARVMLTVSPADIPGSVLWADTATGGGVGARTWNLRGRDGQIVAPGRYALRAYASDSVGQISPTIERILVVSREGVDTLALPAPLGPSAFAPETLHLKHGSPGALVAGLLVAATAVALPSALGNPDLQTGAAYPASYAVAGTIGVASVIGFFRGSRVRPLPENALRNQQTRDRDAAERLGMAQENTRRRAAAPIHIHLEGPGQ